ncbi:hypothetical protein R6Q59_009976 [Mikania micrantha]
MSTPGPSWRQPWTKLGMTTDLAKAVFKNALPPTAALWIIQSTSVGQDFDTVGYLPIIVTILMPPALPRMPYLRSLAFTLILLCITVCVTILAGYCSIQARLHTIPSGGTPDDYNSSAAAVSGIWLIFAIWALQTFRTYKPHRTKSVVLCAILSEVSIVTSAQLHSLDSVIASNLQTFETFLLGLALSAFTSLFIFPQSSRDVTLADIVKLFEISEKATAFTLPFGDDEAAANSAATKEASVSQVELLSQTFTKFQIDVADAKKDIGWSIFSPGDYKEFMRLFRVFVIPLRGLFAIESIRTTLHFGADATQFDKKMALEEADGVDSKESWDAIFKILREPTSQLHQLTEEAVNHCRIVLHLPGSNMTTQQSKQTRSNSEDTGPAITGSNKTTQQPKEPRSDPEDTDPEILSRELPGGAGFVQQFEQRIQQQRMTLKLILSNWKEENYCSGLIDEAGLNSPLVEQQQDSSAQQGRFLFGLYVEHLYNGVLEALLEIVMFCDQFSGSQVELRWPGKKRMLNLVRKLTDHHHIEGDIDEVQSEIPDLTPQRSRAPEKAPKKRFGFNLQQIDHYLDKVFAVIGSPQSFFGLRVACAVLTVVIVALLERTQQWFFNQRGLWSAVFIPFSMAPSSGEAKSMLTFRVLGTLCSIPLGILNWYIVDGIPAGIIVFFFVFMFISQHFLVKYPQWGSFWKPCVITYSIIMGYSLQTKHTHVPAPPATLDHDYPVYLIGPYRALCTLIGVTVAYFWTVFPQPTTANSVMRRRLGQALFVLTEYHSCMHWAICSWAEGHQGVVDDKTSVAHRLMKTRHKLFAKEMALLTVIRNQHKFADYDITLGGNYAEHRFVTMADEVDRVITYMNVVIFVSAYFQSYLHNLSRRPLDMGSWESGVDALHIACKSMSRQVASLIHILASSVTNNQPLPPYLETPEPFGVSKKMRELRPDLMDIRHADEEGYKAFGVIEVSVAMLTKSLDKIRVLVTELMGEVGVDPNEIKNR